MSVVTFGRLSNFPLVMLPESHKKLYKSEQDDLL